MNTIGLKFLSNQAKKLTTAAIGISKRIIKTCIWLQYNAAVFPVYVLYGGLMYAYKKSCASDIENVPSVEPKTAVVVDAVKKLRNSLISGMSAVGSSRSHTEANHVNLNDSVNGDQQNICEPDVCVPNSTMERCSSFEKIDINPAVTLLGVSEFSGGEFMWDIPIISAKAKHFAQCLGEKRENHIETAIKALEEHSVKSPMPNTRQKYNEMLEKVMNEPNYSENSSEEEIYISESENVGKCKVVNVKVDSDVFEENSKEVDFCVNPFSRHSQRHIAKPSCNPFMPQNRIMCGEIVQINKTLRKIQVTCSRLLGGVTNLNEDLAKVISMKEKLTSLEFKVDEGKRLLKEVESDRFIMKSKLSALEKLIHEEEKFLSGDASCESGFYESENVETTSEF